MNQLLEEILNNCRSYTKEGKLASYIPELEKADPGKLGICVADNHSIHTAGDFFRRCRVSYPVREFLEAAGGKTKRRAKKCQ